MKGKLTIDFDLDEKNNTLSTGMKTEGIINGNMLLAGCAMVLKEMEKDSAKENEGTATITTEGLLVALGAILKGGE